MIDLLAADNQYVPYEGSNADARKDFPKGFYPAVGSGLAFKASSWGHCASIVSWLP